MNLIEVGPTQTFVWNHLREDENKLAGLKDWESHPQYQCLDDSCANKNQCQFICTQCMMVLNLQTFFETEWYQCHHYTIL